MPRADPVRAGVGPLAGRVVLVTRPAGRAGGLARAVALAGGRALLVPAIEIAAPADPQAAGAAIARLAEIDIAIFLSVNAVERGLEMVEARHGAWPPGVAICAVGSGTAAALVARGLAVDVVPSGASSSEALLDEPRLAAPALAGRRVALFRGAGGRDLLPDTLRERGAEVVPIETYRRVCPGGTLASRLGEPLAGVDVVTVTSGDAMRNIAAMAGADGRDWLARVGLVAGSARIAGVAVELGCRATPVIAASPADDAMMTALEEWATRHAAARDGTQWERRA